MTSKAALVWRGVLVSVASLAATACQLEVDALDEEPRPGQHEMRRQPGQGPATAHDAQPSIAPPPTADVHADTSMPPQPPEPREPTPTAFPDLKDPFGLPPRLATHPRPAGIHTGLKNPFEDDPLAAGQVAAMPSPPHPHSDPDLKDPFAPSHPIPPVLPPVGAPSSVVKDPFIE